MNKEIVLKAKGISNVKQGIEIKPLTSFFLACQLYRETA